MINLESIKNAQYNNEKSAIVFTYLNGKRYRKTGMVSPPPEGEKSVVYDYIVDTVGLGALEKAYNDRQAKKIEQIELREQRNEERREQEKIAHRVAELFHTKTQLLKMPWINPEDTDLVANIRCASHMLVVQAISSAAFLDYMKSNNKTYEEINDEVEEALYG